MHTPIKLREKIGYGLGDAASSMFWKLFGSYLLFFYTDVFGLPAAAAGTMFLVTRLWDSFVDPVVGVLADRTRSRRGKFRPYLLRFAVPASPAYSPSPRPDSVRRANSSMPTSPTAR